MMKATTSSRAMKRSTAWTFVIVAALIPVKASAQSGEYSAPRNAVVNAAGARIIRISASSGFLYVNGRPGLTQVRVTGTARASSQRVLSEIRLLAERQGDMVVVKVVMPDETSSFWDLFRGDYARALDLTIDVPIGTPLDVSDGSGELTIKGTGPVTLTDGSGDLEVSGITGNVRITDGSGNMSISGVDGDVNIDDGSGNIDANNVTGNFTIGDDGSGSVDINGVGGSMHISEKGSGGVKVSRVGGDFIVDSKGSGSIDYDTVKGTVNIPERRRGRYRR
jgi:hypothetical protein